MRHSRTRDKAFTLIELLIVSVILSVVSLAIYSSFSSGLRIWKRVNAPIGDEDTVLFLERLGQELRSTAAVRDPGFLGAENRVEIPMAVNSRRMGARTPGKTVYSFSADKGEIRRSVSDYSALFSGSQAEGTAVLSGLKSAKFSFYRYDRLTRRFEWVDSWSQAEAPVAVRLELERKDSGEPLTRTFAVPVGSVPAGSAARRTIDG